MTAEQSGRLPEPAQEAIARAFGAENRARLLARYFNDAGDISIENAWQHVYRLLLWIDRTTALAHCYESDKAQPGRAWYARHSPSIPGCPMRYAPFQSIWVSISTGYSEKPSRILQVDHSRRARQLTRYSVHRMKGGASPSRVKIPGWRGS